MEMTEKELLCAGIGRKIVFLGRAADMISISLSSSERCQYEYIIHISAKGEILLDGKVITGTADIKEDAQLSMTMFDKKVKELTQLGKDFELKNIFYDNDGCLFAEFSNALLIRSINESFTSSEDAELWRVFLHWSPAPHLVATQKGVFFEESNFTQEELNKVRTELKLVKENRTQKN